MGYFSDKTKGAAAKMQAVDEKKARAQNPKGFAALAASGRSTPSSTSTYSAAPPSADPHGDAASAHAGAYGIPQSQQSPTQPYKAPTVPNQVPVYGSAEWQAQQAAQTSTGGEAEGEDPNKRPSYVEELGGGITAWGDQQLASINEAEAKNANSIEEQYAQMMKDAEAQLARDQRAAMSMNAMMGGQMGGSFLAGQRQAAVSGLLAMGKLSVDKMKELSDNFQKSEALRLGISGQTFQALSELQVKDTDLKMGDWQSEQDDIILQSGIEYSDKQGYVKDPGGSGLDIPISVAQAATNQTAIPPTEFLRRVAWWVKNGNVDWEVAQRYAVEKDTSQAALAELERARARTRAIEKAQADFDALMEKARG